MMEKNDRDKRSLLVACASLKDVMPADDGRELNIMSFFVTPPPMNVLLFKQSRCTSLLCSIINLPSIIQHIISSYRSLIRDIDVGVHRGPCPSSNQKPRYYR